MGTGVGTDVAAGGGGRLRIRACPRSDHRPARQLGRRDRRGRSARRSSAAAIPPSGCTSATPARLNAGRCSAPSCRSNLGPARRASAGSNTTPGRHGVAWTRSAANNSCADVFSHGQPRFIAPSCADVSPGAGKLGATCEDLDVICESSNCLPSTGTCGPPRGCPADCDVGQYCDEIADGCTPLKTDGTACREQPRVRVAARPSAGRWFAGRLSTTAPPADQTRTASAASASSPRRTPPAADHCSGNGEVCVRDEDCASGACVGTAPALTCGAPLPDGARCAADSACVSGTLSDASAARRAHLWPPFCDGASEVITRGPSRRRRGRSWSRASAG